MSKIANSLKETKMIPQTATATTSPLQKGTAIPEEARGGQRDSTSPGTSGGGGDHRLLPLREEKNPVLLSSVFLDSSDVPDLLDSDTDSDTDTDTDDCSFSLPPLPPLPKESKHEPFDPSKYEDNSWWKASKPTAVAVTPELRRDLLTQDLYCFHGRALRLQEPICESFDAFVPQLPDGRRYVGFGTIQGTEVEIIELASRLYDRNNPNHVQKVYIGYRHAPESEGLIFFRAPLVKTPYKKHFRKLLAKTFPKAKEEDLQKVSGFMHCSNMEAPRIDLASPLFGIRPDLKAFRECFPASGKRRRRRRKKKEPLPPPPAFSPAALARQSKPLRLSEPWNLKNLDKLAASAVLPEKAARAVILAP